ncbi:DUF6662 family protein [Aliikangiella sp. G2MR2-5]|uniref:DUF6662 family protein n=1 Tax=Aliikangiella sp. G2MR2-5 TaxID=2788943 RepID=UPI0018AAB498|nr:DUF6662 family protein [Aliikangiella sp. G2MR2-5]
MSQRTNLLALATSLIIGSTTQPLMAGENLLGTVQGAETLPEGAYELYQKVTIRSDKGQGDYRATNYETELEYGATNKLSVTGSLKMLSLDTSGLIIDGYLPKENDLSLKVSGVEGKLKYMFLSPAMDDIGLSGSIALDYDWVDPHSGQDKDTFSLETALQLQKFMLEGQFVWLGNFGMEATYAKRDELSGLPADFDWPTEPEMEIEFKLGTGFSYRFAPKWFVGFEAFYETEFETEVGQERWSFFAGPSLHYGTADWWWTVSWLPQIKGGGEQYEGQLDTDLHLIEKTEQELKLKVGINF